MEWDRLKSELKTVTLDSLAEWAFKELKLASKPSSSTISRIQKERATLMSSAADLNRKKKSTVSFEALDIALSEWVLDRNARKQCVDGDTIKEKGRLLLQMANAQLPESERIELKFSNGWLDKFQKRYNFKAYTSHGEDGDADQSAIDEQLPSIKAKISKYSLNDVFNADEFGHYFKMAPTRTIGRGAIPGRKKAKSRITYLACANIDGSEKFPLMIIGRSKRPRVFKKKTGQQLGFDYHNNKKAWMNSGLFFAWLHRFDDYIAQTPGRKVALLLDNCSAHGKIDTIPKLK